MQGAARMKKIINRFSLLFIMLLSLVICFVYSESVHAETYNTNSYDVRIIVNKDNTFEYTETIDTDFTTSSHGLFRNIPMSNAYSIDNIKVEGHEYKVIKNDNYNKNLVIKIGSPNRYVFGPQKYIIKYTLTGYNQYHKDFLYLDLFPTSWPTAVGHVNIHVQFPKDFPLDDLKKYSGGYGISDNQFGVFNIDNDKKTVDFTATNLPSNTGVTIARDLPKDYWTGARSKGFITSILLIMGIVVLVILRFTLGKNPKIIKPVEFTSPDGYPPLELGYIIDGVVDKKDISSCLFYLANKGYLKIHDKGNDNFEFELTGYPTDEKRAVQHFFDGIFGNGASKRSVLIGTKIATEDIGTRLGSKVLNIQAAVEAEFVGKNSLYSIDSENAFLFSKLIFFALNAMVFLVYKYYTGFATYDYTHLIIQIMIVLVLAAAMTELASVIVRVFNKRRSSNKSATILKMMFCVVFYLIASYFSTYISAANTFSIYDSKVYFTYWLLLIVTPFILCGMRSRTKDNAILLGRVLGFKNFIATAELAKLEELVEQDPNYFYNILPYAYVFGLTEKWVGKFENIIKVPEPDWYVSSDNMYTGSIFNAYLLSSMIDNVSTSMITTINTVDSGEYSGSSGGFGGGGFSGGGGGFSGGGFGGGGGGSW